LEQLNADVVVVGSGGAGLRAAIEARQAGKRVLVVEARKPGLGSTTFQAASDWMAFGAAVGAADKNDSPYHHYLDICTKGALVCTPHLARLLAEQAPARVEELAAWGMTWDRTPDGNYKQIMSDGASFPRALGRGADTGRLMVEVLLAKAKDEGVELVSGLEVVALEASGEGVNLLCYAGPSRSPVLVCAKAVVLASGGAGSLFKLNLFPPASWGSATLAAFEQGAELVNLEFIQFGPGVLKPARFALSGVFWRLQPVLTNDRGEEFLPAALPEGVDLESALIAKSYSYPYTVRNDSQYVDRAIFEQIARDEDEPGKVFISLAHNPPEVLEDLAAVPLDFWLKRGVDLRQEALEFAPCCQHFNGGLVIDETARTTLPGVFAAGEAEGGPHGADRPGGNALAETQVFGRIAGASAAEYAETSALPEAGSAARWAEATWKGLLEQVKPDGLGSETVEQLRWEMWRNCSLVRTAEGLKALQAELADTRERLMKAGASDLPTLLALRSLTGLGEAVAQAALARTESRGTHYRADCPGKNLPEWEAQLVLSLEAGELRLKRRPLDLPEELKALRDRLE